MLVRALFENAVPLSPFGDFQFFVHPPGAPLKQGSKADRDFLLFVLCISTGILGPIF